MTTKILLYHKCPERNMMLTGEVPPKNINDIISYKIKNTIIILYIYMNIKYNISIPTLHYNPHIQNHQNFNFRLKSYIDINQKSNYLLLITSVITNDP